MNSLSLEMGIMNDQFKIETIMQEYEIFTNLTYRNNVILTEDVADTFKKVTTFIKEKLISLKDKFLKAVNFIKDKIKDFFARFKKESFDLVDKMGTGKIMAGEKIKVSTVYDINKITTFVDNLYNNNYVKNIKNAINISNNVINYMNSGNFRSVFTEINASKDKLPKANKNRDAFADGNAKVEITDDYKLNKDKITGKEAAEYFKSINKFVENIENYMSAISKINKDILDPSIKCVDKLVIKDKNKIKNMNLQELNWQKSLVEWLKCVTSWTLFGESYINMFVSIMSQVTESMFTIIKASKTMSIQMNKND